jgi:hypothetical protein
MTIAHERVYDAVCRKPGPYADLRNVVGSLVVEYDKQGHVKAVMFEPLDERIGNLDLPDIDRVLMDDKLIRVQETDDGMFVFEVIPDIDDERAEEDDDDGDDNGAAEEGR